MDIAFVGKGQDLQNLVHEYATNDQKTLKEIRRCSGLFYHNKNKENLMPVALGKKLSETDKAIEFDQLLHKKPLYISGADSI